MTKFELPLSSRALAIDWPRVVSELRQLRHLRVYYEDYMPWIDMATFSWSLVPSQLVKLQLCFGLLVPLPGDVVLPHLDSLSLEWIDILVDSTKNSGPIPDLHHSAPQLRELRLIPRKSESGWTDLHLAFLPSNLTTLVGSFENVRSIEGTYAWPSALQQLHLKVRFLHEIIAPFMASLPTSLVALTLRPSASLLSSDLDWSLSNLPNLASLGIYAKAVTPDKLSQLPSRITSLDLCNSYRANTEALLASLPNNLVHLRGASCTLRVLTTPLLPRSLTEFSGTTITPFPLSLLPPGLTRLRHDGALDPAMQHLPLTSLYMPFIQRSTADPDWKFLPQKTLTNLCILRITTRILKLLPPTLTFLECTEAMDTEDFHLLPPALLTLKVVGGPPLTKSTLALCPRTLTSLHINTREIKNPHFFEGAPPGLVYLYLENFFGLRPKMLAPLRNSTSLAMLVLLLRGVYDTYGAFLTQLPLRLINLQIGLVCKSMDISVEELTSLPRSLASLVIPISPQHAPDRLSLPLHLHSTALSGTLPRPRWPTVD